MSKKRVFFSAGVDVGTDDLSLSAIQAQITQDVSYSLMLPSHVFPTLEADMAELAEKIKQSMMAVIEQSFWGETTTHLPSPSLTWEDVERTHALLMEAKPEKDDIAVRADALYEKLQMIWKKREEQGK